MQSDPVLDLKCCYIYDPMLLDGDQKLVKFAWGLFLKLFRRGFTIVSPVLAFARF